jgi:hypothetical protein
MLESSSSPRLHEMKEEGQLLAVGRYFVASELKLWASRRLNRNAYQDLCLLSPELPHATCCLDHHLRTWCLSVFYHPGD